MTTKKTEHKTERKAIPYIVIARMIEQGNDALTIAKKLNRITKGTDATHSIRAIISRMRTVGYKDARGKICKLKVARVGKAA